MTMATLVYSSFKEAVAEAIIDMDANTFNVMLVQDAYTPAAAHDFRNDVTNEVGASGSYATGGSALTSITSALSGTEYRFDAADPSWTSATITARGCVIYKVVGSSATDNLVCSLLFTGGADVTSTNGTFTIQFDATGILALQ